MRPKRALLPRPGRLFRPAVAAAVLAALACGDSTGPGASSFSATITGATNRSYSGDALALAEAGVGFSLLLETVASSGPDQLEVFLIRETPDIPSPGTYDVVAFSSGPAPDEFVGFLTISHGEDDERDCDSTEGTITVTSASSRGVAGSFDFSMTCVVTNHPEAAPETASIEGTFEAVVAVDL